MPDLLHVLREYDLHLLTLIAEVWEVELTSSNPRDAAAELAPRLRRPEAVAEVLDGLDPEALRALTTLRRARQPLAQFVRRYGELRAMGPARREREQPWRNEPSITEMLWYRALLARGFFDDGAGAPEGAHVPADPA